MLCLCGGSHALAQQKDASPPPDETPITIPELQSHAAFLASDTLEGREAGSAGGRATAAYLADELRRLQYQPLGSKTDYRQPFGAGYQNVLGLLVGSDPKLKDEWIVIGAHFDHVGFGNRDNSQGPLGQVHNGADDNASGVSCLLEMAEALRGSPPLRRSIAIAFWDAEEKGLLGSEHWLAHCPNRPQLRFYTNIDMVGRLRNNTLEVYGLRTMPGLRSVLARSNISNLQIKDDWSQQNDSDHYNFYVRGIPYLMPFSGLHDDYHRPSDDVEKLNFQGIEQVAQMLMQQTIELANRPEPLTFREASRYELSKVTPGAALPSRLGVSWSPARRPGETIKLTRIDPGMPADRAGLQPGDELLRINGQEVREIDNFAIWVRQSPQHWEIDLLRAKTNAPESVALELDGCPLPAGALAASDSAEPGMAVITAVAASSPAAKAGFRFRDRIHSAEDGPPPASRRWQVEREGRLIQLPAAEATP